MSNCNDIRGQLKAYADNELSTAAERGVREHVETCRGCREELEEIHTLTRTLTSVMWETPSPALRERILASLPPEKKPAKNWLGGWIPNGWMIASGAAAAVILLVIFLSPQSGMMDAKMARSTDTASAPAPAAGGTASAGMPSASSNKAGKKAEVAKRYKDADGRHSAKLRAESESAESQQKSTPILAKPGSLSSVESLQQPVTGGESAATLKPQTTPLSTTITPEALKRKAGHEDDLSRRAKQHVAKLDDRAKNFADKVAVSSTTGNTQLFGTRSDGLAERSPVGKSDGYAKMTRRAEPQVATKAMGDGEPKNRYVDEKASDAPRSVALGVKPTNAPRDFDRINAMAQPPVVFFVEQLDTKTVELKKQIQSVGGTVESQKTVKLEDGARMNDFYAFVPQKDAEKLVQQLKKMEPSSVREEAEQYRSALNQLPEIRAYNLSLSPQYQNSLGAGGFGGGGGRGGLGRGAAPPANSGAIGGSGLGGGGLGGGLAGGGGFGGSAGVNPPGQVSKAGASPAGPGGVGGPYQSPTQQSGTNLQQQQQSLNRQSRNDTEYRATRGMAVGKDVSGAKTEDQIKLYEQSGKEVRQQDSRVLNLMRNSSYEDLAYRESNLAARVGAVNGSQVEMKKLGDFGQQVQPGAPLSAGASNYGRANKEQQDQATQARSRMTLGDNIPAPSNGQRLHQRSMQNNQQGLGASARQQMDWAMSMPPSGMVMFRFQLREPPRTVPTKPAAIQQPRQPAGARQKDE